MLNFLQKSNPLNHPYFRRLWLGLLFSYLGDQFAMVALLWFTLQKTGSGIALASILLCFSLPGILTSPFLGYLLDRVQPRLLMGLDNLLRALFIGLIPILYLFGKFDLWLLYPLAFGVGLVTPATNVGIRVILPQLISDQQLENANAFLSMADQSSFLLGPALAGVLVSLVGGPPLLLVDAVSFLVMALTLYTLPDVALQSHHVDTATTGQNRNIEKFRALFRLKEIWIITALSFIFFLSYGPLEPALPLYVQQNLDAGSSGYGLLWSIFGLGTLAGLLTIPYLSKQSRPGIVFSIIAILWGLLLIPLFWITNLAWAMLFFCLAGCSWGPYTTIEVPLLQRLTPAQLCGQIFGLRSTLLGLATPLGIFIGGILLYFMPAPSVIGISALACITSGILGLLFPALRKITRN